jgi:hypothetical protein
MKFHDRDSGDRGMKPRAEVYRLPDGQVVYMERDINVEGWARITRLSKCIGSTTTADSRWTYTSADDAASALAAWDPEKTKAPAGWFICGQGKNSAF